MNNSQGYERTIMKHSLYLHVHQQVGANRGKKHIKIKKIIETTFFLYMIAISIFEAIASSQGNVLPCS